MNLLVYYTTYPDKETAQKISRILLEKQLIACANLYPIDSLYHWKGEIVEEQEWVAILKSSAQLKDQLIQTINEIHPYDVPCIVHWAADANPEYLKWVKESCLEI
jgi:periplasmic divalent cation tolerance protein